MMWLGVAENEAQYVKCPRVATKHLISLGFFFYFYLHDISACMLGGEVIWC